MSRIVTARQVETMTAHGVNNNIEVGKHTVRNLMYLCAKARRNRISDNINDASFVQFLKENGSMTIGQLITSGRIKTRTGLDYLADQYYRGIIDFADIDGNPITNKTEVILIGK